MKSALENSVAPAPVAPPTQFHLFSVPAFVAHDSVSTPPGNTDASPLVVPCGVSRLDYRKGIAPSLIPAPAGHPTSNPLLEPLPARAAEPRLLLTNPPGVGLRVNGTPAPRLTLLSEGDRFHFDHGPSFSVALFHRPHHGPTPPPLIGVACGVCSLPLTAEDRCLVCACGTALHAAADETRAGALACHKIVTHCPHCETAVRLAPAYGERSALDALSHPYE